jgi:hypothetical protein
MKIIWLPDRAAGEDSQDSVEEEEDRKGWCVGNQQ